MTLLSPIIRWLHKHFASVCLIAALLWPSSLRAESPAQLLPIADKVKIEETNETKVQVHFWRAALGEALAIGAGTAWYWIDRDRQVADWDSLSWSQRLTLDVIRYDNNPFNINFGGHALNGASYHAIARANGLGLYASAGLGLLTSITWEYALEFREKVSINELLRNAPC